MGSDHQERKIADMYGLSSPEAELNTPDSASSLLEKFKAIETALEEIKGLLLQIIEPSLYKQIRIEDIARKFSQGDKTALRQWNMEQKRKTQKC